MPIGFFTRFARFARQRSPHQTARHTEAGFMLAAATVLVLVLVALLSSFAFVAQRDFRFKNNFAAGERMAQMATSAHLFAQQYAHHTLPAPENMLGDILFNSADPMGSPMPLPDQVLFRPVGGIKYDVVIRGWGESPINTSGTVAADKASSAYMHIKIRPVDGQAIRPSDRTAFLSGASSRGLNRTGIVGLNIEPGDLCDGSQTVIRWGPEDSACLSNTHLATLGFSDVQNGDMIVPTWEVALITTSRNALYRYRQPERPELNAMRADLNMNGNDVQDISRVITDNIQADGMTTMDDVVVRSGHPTNINHAITNNALNIRIDDASTPAMQVSGAIQFQMTPATQVNIANTLEVGPATSPLNVDVATPVMVETVENMGQTLDIIPHNPSDTLSVAAAQSSTPLAGLAVIGDGVHLAIANTLHAEVGTIMRAYSGSTMQIYSGAFNTLPNNAVPVGLSFSPTSMTIPFETGAVEQIGSGTNNYLRVPTVNTFDCTGIACPDYVTENPGGGL